MPCPSLHPITCSASKQILNSISIQYLLKSSAIISDTLHTYNVILLFYNLLFDQHVIMLKYIFFPYSSGLKSVALEELSTIII